MSLKAIMVALTITAAIPAISQVVPSAEQGGLPLKIGAGFSYFNSSIGQRMIGGGLWVDSSPTRLPLSQHGLGLEAEARYVTVGQVSPTAGGIFHQGTAGGGPTYTLRGFGRIRPYAKFIISFAGQNFYVGGAKNYRHDTQMAYAPGGGVDYRVFSHLWARADYEYQIWPNPFSNPNWILDPQGFTVGAAWDLGSMHRH